MATTGFVSVTVQHGDLKATMSLAEDVLVSKIGESIGEHDDFRQVFGDDHDLRVTKFEVELEGGHKYEFDELLAELDDPESTLKDVGTSIIILLIDGTAPSMGSLPVHVEGKGQVDTLQVAQTVSATDVHEALKKLFTGEIAATKISFPGKKGMRDLATPFKASQAGEPLLERIASEIATLPPMLRPPAVDCIEKLQLKLPDTVKPLSDGVDEREGGGGEGGGDEGGELQQREVAALAQQIKISCRKHAADECETRKACGLGADGGSSCYARFSKEMVTTKPRGGKDPVTKVVTIFKCGLCEDGSVRQKDSAHGGTLRHMCGDAHLKKLVASQWTELAASAVGEAATDLANYLPVCYTKARKANTTLFKAGQQRKEAASRVKAAAALMTGPELAQRAPATPVTPLPFQGFSPAGMGAAIAGLDSPAVAASPVAN